jgi:hypothetical protein
MFFARKSTIFVDFLSKTIPMPHGAPVRIITCAELSHCQGLLQPRLAKQGTQGTQVLIRGYFQLESYDQA